MQLTAVHGGGIYEWLERGTGLPQCLGCPVELAVVEVITADHGLDLAGLRLNRNDATLNFRLLLERNFDFPIRRTQRTDHEQRDVTRLQDLGYLCGFRPRNILRGQLRLV